MKDGKPEAEKGKMHIQVTAWGTDLITDKICAFFQRPGENLDHPHNILHLKKKKIKED